jgi:hypothetical protein
MNTKLITYLLIVSLIIIWGIIFFKISFSKVDTEKKITTNIKKINKSVENDYWIIVADYRNPFEQFRKNDDIILSPSKQFIKKILPNRLIKETEKKKKIVWPIISYKGLVKNQKSQSVIAIINVNGSEKLIKEGDKINDFMFEKIYKDSVLIKMDGEKKIYKK